MNLLTLFLFGYSVLVTFLFLYQRRSLEGCAHFWINKPSNLVKLEPGWNHVSLNIKNGKIHEQFINGKQE